MNRSLSTHNNFLYKLRSWISLVMILHWKIYDSCLKIIFYRTIGLISHIVINNEDQFFFNSHFYLIFYVLHNWIKLCTIAYWYLALLNFLNPINISSQDLFDCLKKIQSSAHIDLKFVMYLFELHVWLTV